MSAKTILALSSMFVAIAIGYIAMSRAAPSAAPIEGTEPSSADHSKRHIKLTAEQLEKAGFATEVARPAAIRELLPLFGTIAPNAERARDIAARYPGTIRSVQKRVGDPVTQGEELAVVEGNESLQAYRIMAPLTGVVTARHVNPGELTGDKVLFTVADLSNVWVELSLFPRDAAKVHAGQSVRVKSADSATSGEGVITYVASIGNSASQTRNARVLIDNKDGQWAPGLFVAAEVTLNERQVPVAIRNQAIQSLDGSEAIFVQTEKGFEPRTIIFGRRDGEYSEVLEGIMAGESYVTRNSFLLKAELGKSEAGE